MVLRELPPDTPQPERLLSSEDSTTSNSGWRIWYRWRRRFSHRWLYSGPSRTGTTCPNRTGTTNCPGRTSIGTNCPGRTSTVAVSTVLVVRVPSSKSNLQQQWSSINYVRSQHESELHLAFAPIPFLSIPFLVLRGDHDVFSSTTLSLLINWICV